MTDDLTIVAQYATSSGPPGKVYNAASRLLDSAALIDGFLAVVSPELDRLRAERDALRAAIKLARDDAITRRQMTGVTHDRWLLGAYTQACRTLQILNAALECVENGAESHGDGRNPQTQGASEGQEAGEAQEARDGQ